MFYYSPSPSSLGHSLYAPRRSYRPASYYLYDEPSPAVTFENLGFSPFSSAFEPRVDPEARYRRALHELEVAEHDLEAHIALERARQVTAIRQRAAAEAARRERARAALQAEIERIEHARANALQAQVEERLARRQQARWARAGAAFDRSCFRGRPLFHAVADANTEEISTPRCCPVDRRPTRPTSSLPRSDDEVLTLGEILKLFTGVDPEPPRASAPQRPTSPTPAPSQPSGPAEPKPESPEGDNAEATLNDILEFFHGIASQARGVVEQSTSSQDEPTPVDRKGKGKAKAEEAPEPTLFQTLFSGRLDGALDQEMRDLEEAIKLSLQDRDAAAVKQAQASKASRSSPGASSSKVTIGDATSSSGPTSSADHNASARAPSPQSISPLTSIRAVRSQFSTLESAFKFPPALDFDHSELAVSTNNAPVRAYEQALTGLLEQLDAIESDGDDEVREVRRNVVREVERALEDVERKVKEKAPQASVPEVTKEEVVEGYDVEGETAAEAEPLSSQAVPSDDVALVTISGSVKPTSAPVAVSLADADIDQAILEEYQYRSASPVAASSDSDLQLDGSAALAPAAATEVGGVLPRDAEAVPAPVDDLSGSSDSAATLIPRAPTAPAPRPSKVTAGVPSAPESETFLESMSHAQFTFPPKPASSGSSGMGFGEAQDDAVLVGDDSSGDEVGSVRAAGGEDGWSEVDA